MPVRDPGLEEEPLSNPAEAYERFIVQNVFVPWTADLIERARPQIGERVLDLACGTGIVTRSVAPLVGSEGKVTALDISPEMLEVARAVSSPDGITIEWHQGSGTEMPFQDESFDLVLCQQGFQFFDDHAAGMSEIRRVLGPGGRAFVSVWTGLDYTPFMKALDEVISTHLAESTVGRAFALNDAVLFERLAQDGGFERTEVEEVGLTVHAREPETFISMMVQSGVLMSPELSERTEEERRSLIEKSQSDMVDASQPFIHGDVLELDTVANILSAGR